MTPIKDKNTKQKKVFISNKSIYRLECDARSHRFTLDIL